MKNIDWKRVFNALFLVAAIVGILLCKPYDWRNGAIACIFAAMLTNTYNGWR